MGSILPFPMPESTQPHPELPGALTYSAPENLVNEAVRIMGRVAHLAHSLSDDQRITLLGELLALDINRLTPLQEWVERRRSVLSDLSARQAKKRRRRQRRVKEQLSA